MRMGLEVSKTIINWLLSDVNITIKLHPITENIFEESCCA